MRILKVVIVEDHPLTMRSLVQTIAWESLGCEIIGTAADGESGRDLILQTEPDILLTDIHMPRLSGLDMLDAVVPLYPNMKVIIITGFDQFQYASRAIKLSVFDYLLKPLQNEEVEATIRRAADQLRQQSETDSVIAEAKETIIKAQLTSLLTNPAYVGLSVHRMMSEHELESDSYYILLVQSPTGVFQGAELDRIEEHLHSMALRYASVVLYDSLVIYVMRDQQDDSWRGEAESVCRSLMTLFDNHLFIGVSMQEHSHHRIRQTYQQARIALWQSAISSANGSWVFYSEESADESSLMADAQHRILALLENAELTEASAANAADVLIELSGRQYSRLRSYVSFYALMLTKKFPCRDSSAVDKALEQPWFVTSNDDVKASLIALTDSLREGAEADDSHCSLLTHDVLKYIQLHGAEKIQLNDVAERFHVTPNYLSGLIRRETGSTFLDHVLQAKMDIAHTMLADPRILVEEIAHAVGYSNYVSFYNAFKKMEGMTPTEYRNHLAGMSGGTLSGK